MPEILNLLTGLPIEVTVRIGHWPEMHCETIECYQEARKRLQKNFGPAYYITLQSAVYELRGYPRFELLMPKESK